MTTSSEKMEKPALSGRCYKIINRETHISVELAPGILPKEATELSALLEKTPEFTNLPWIFDCSNLVKLSHAESRLLLNSKKQNERTAVLAHLKSPKLLEEAGLDKALRLATTLKEALSFFSTTGTPRPASAEIVNAFLGATIKVLRSQTNLNITTGKPSILNGPLTFDIAGFASFESTNFNGSLVLGFTKNTLLSLIARSLNEAGDKTNAQIHKFLSELINLVYGTAKSTLQEKGHTFSSIVPAVLEGPSQAVPQMKNQTVVLVPASESQIGSFNVLIGISSNN